MMRHQNLGTQQFKRMLIFSASAVSILIILSILYQSLLVPLCLSLLLAYLLSPTVTRLTKPRRPRILIISALLSVFLGLGTIFILRIIPNGYREILRLIKLAPKGYATVTEIWIPSLRQFIIDVDLIKVEHFDNFVTESQNIIKLSEKIQQALTGLWTTAPQFLNFLFHLGLIPILTFFFLKDYDKIKGKLSELIPRDLLQTSSKLGDQISLTLRALIKGQVIVAATLGVLYMLGLSIVGIESAIAIGFIAGCARIVPYLDVVVGVFLCSIVILSDFHGYGQFLGVGIVFLLVQSLDGMFITPKVIGNRVGLHPLVVIVSILSFGQLFGFWGVILAIPAIAVAKILYIAILPYYLNSQLYYHTSISTLEAEKNPKPQH